MGKMFVAGYLDKDKEMIEELFSVMEAARVGACQTRDERDPPVRIGGVELRGPSPA